jgi:arylsulfatase A-like enzyme
LTNIHIDKDCHKEYSMNKQPNVLFLLSDQHSYRCFSHLNPDGEGEPVHTPTLDGLAARATVFHQTYCQVAICTASRICMLTGLSPMRSGGWTNWSYLKPGNQTLLEAFAEAAILPVWSARCIWGQSPVCWLSASSLR